MYHLVCEFLLDLGYAFGRVREKINEREIEVKEEEEWRSKIEGK
jgi:hypothetical protein